MNPAVNFFTYLVLLTFGIRQHEVQQAFRVRDNESDPIGNRGVHGVEQAFMPAIRDLKGSASAAEVNVAHPLNGTYSFASENTPKKECRERIIRRGTFNSTE